MKNLIISFILSIIRKIYPLINVAKEEYKQQEIKRISNTFHQCGKNFKISHPFIINGTSNIIIGNNFQARQNFRLDAIVQYNNQKFKPLIEIGDNVSCEVNCHIGCIYHIKIGEGTMIASNVLITDHIHGNTEEAIHALQPAIRPLYSKGAIIIGKNVLIGDNVSIMPGVTIGDNVIIGANSVVTKSFTDNLVIAGIPAKIIKNLS